MKNEPMQFIPDPKFPVELVEAELQNKDCWYKVLLTCFMSLPHFQQQHHEMKMNSLNPLFKELRMSLKHVQRLVESNVLC